MGGQKFIWRTEIYMGGQNFIWKTEMYIGDRNLYVGQKSIIRGDENFKGRQKWANNRS